MASPKRARAVANGPWPDAGDVAGLLTLDVAPLQDRGVHPHVHHGARATGGGARVRDRGHGHHRVGGVGVVALPQAGGPSLVEHPGLERLRAGQYRRAGFGRGQIHSEGAVGAGAGAQVAGAVQGVVAGLLVGNSSSADMAAPLG